MDKNELLELLTIEKLKELMTQLGSEYCKEEQGCVIFQVFVMATPLRISYITIKTLKLFIAILHAVVIIVFLT